MTNENKKLAFTKKAIALAALCCLLAACQPVKNTAAPSATATNNPSTQPTATPLTPDEAGYDYNSLVGVDQFGRAFTAVNGMKTDRLVGMFYWLWIGQPQASAVYDATKILAMENGLDILVHQADNPASPNGQPHYWGEPLWGYYNSADPWVIRRQMKMIAAAGVDFIYFDTTNAQTYPNVYREVCKVIEELQNEGWKMPGVVFYTHSKSLDTTRKIYSEFYSKNLYPSTWFKIDGKPLIIAYNNVLDDKAEAATRGDTHYNPKEFSQEIQDFFFFKKPNWPSDSSYPSGFPWVEWHFPQPLHGTKPSVMNVTVASHPGVPMSFSLTGRSVNWGRGWDPKTKQNVAENVEKGTFFQLQWDNAIKADPDIISVGGWNEWIAWKQPWGGEYMLCDATDMEYSRDIEPMNGGYEDSFYLQLAANIRRYKGTGASTLSYPARTVDITKANAFESVNAVFRSIGTKEPARSYKGGAIKMNTADTSALKYTSPAPRNNLQEIRVASDANNVYFYIRTQENITSYEAGENNWMNIYIGTGTPSQKGWNGYEYVVNRTPGSGTTSVDKLNADFSAVSAGTAQYMVTGNVLQVSIPKAALGITGATELYFKVSDGVENAENIMNTYLTGKSMPMGRLSYWYKQA